MSKRKEVILRLDHLQKEDNLSRHLTASISEEMPLRGFLFEDETLSSEDKTLADVESVHFLRCRFESVNFEKSSFVNVKFSNCDLSNCTFKDAYFKDVILENCKGVGTQFVHSSIKTMLIRDCNMNYSNFGQAKLENCSFLTSQFQSASISQTTLKALHISQCQFHSTDFFHTFLRGVDFSDSDLEGLLLSDDLTEVKGSKMNLYQAAAIAQLLGIQII